MSDGMVKIRNTSNEPVHMSILGRDVAPGEVVEVHKFVAKKVHDAPGVPWEIVG
jgi:hypothetical protein